MYFRILFISALISYGLNNARADEAATPPQANTPAASATPELKASETSGEHKAEPFAFGDFTWLNGNSRQTEFPLDGKVFSGEFTLDANYVYDFANPQDHSLDGSTNTGRTNEIQVEQLGVGGDFHYDNVRGRLFTQFGMYSTMTPRNDASPGRGQWDLADAYRYISEAYGGYHWDVWNGINLDAGIFMSYIGLCSYYNYENWVYQMSYVSANTPWFFNGLRLQTFPSDKLKVELWLINGWQSYGMFNEAPGVGWQVLWRPNTDVSFVSNEYMGHDFLGTPGRMRVHSDNSFLYRYYENQGSVLSKGAFSLTLDIGCENGGGVSCANGNPADPSQNFIGFMVYNRLWFAKDHYGLTIGGGGITNPGRYLVLLPPINGATAYSGTPYFTENPGDQFRAVDGTVTFDYMPNQFITFRIEYNHRQANVPYFAGSGGMTPPGGNNGNPAATVPGWSPDLTTVENRVNVALMVRL